MLLMCASLYLCQYQLVFFATIIPLVVIFSFHTDDRMSSSWQKSEFVTKVDKRNPKCDWLLMLGPQWTIFEIFILKPRHFVTYMVYRCLEYVYCVVNFLKFKIRFQINELPITSKKCPKVKISFGKNEMLRSSSKCSDSLKSVTDIWCFHSSIFSRRNSSLWEYLWFFFENS